MPRSEKMENLTEWSELSKLAMQDRRKGKRVPLAFPIEVSGFDRTGRHFSEATKTGDVVAIKLIPRGNGLAPASKALLFQIAWVKPEADGWAAGALKLQPENIWHMSFPPGKQSKPSSE